jgi:tetratricopeptide (TPR) repeat protein
LRRAVPAIWLDSNPRFSTRFQQKASDIMALDVYQPCLGGMPRKIKFCQCGKDMLGDLEKIVDAIGGNQRAGALSHINRMLESRGNRACLLALKGLVQLHMGDLERLVETADEFSQAHPENPIASGLSSIAAASKGEIDDAIDCLQNALRDSDSEIHEIVYNALDVVCQTLMQLGDVLAARAHLSLQAAIAPPSEKQEIMGRLLRLVGSANVPLLLKQRFELDEVHADVLWRDAFQTALQTAAKGIWGEAFDRFKALADELPDQGVIWRNTAILAGYLSQPDEAAEAWRRYAALDSVDLDDAVEAEALAQFLLDEEQLTIDEVRQVYPITDSERVMERMLSERHVDSIAGDLSALGNEESPPPKAAFWILDRELPASGENLTVADVPNVLGQAFLFGRETDRQARVEFITTRTSDFHVKSDVIRKLLGEYGGEVESEQAVGQVDAARAAMGWRWRLPDDVPPEVRAQLISDKHRDMHLNVWPETPLPQLNGKSPVEAASDPSLRVRVLAAILLLELGAEQGSLDFDLNDLRAKLGLPTRDDLPVQGLDVSRVPLIRLHLLPPEQLDDEQLLSAYGYAWMHRAPRAVNRLAPEVLQRPGLRSKVDVSEIHYALSLFASDADQALQSIHNAQEAAEAAGHSPARWLLHELDTRLMRGEPQACESILARLRTQHINEPGVAEAMYGWLVRVGAVAPPGQAGPPQQPAPAAAPPAPGGLWTPDGGTPRGGEGEAKSGLWIPGMD